MRTITYTILAILSLAIYSCTEEYTPKPRGYARIDFPEKTYNTIDSQTYPFSFQIPNYSHISYIKSHKNTSSESWYNIEFPKLNTTLHLSYNKIQNNLRKLTEDAHKMAYKHSIKASSITEKEYLNIENKVYGMLYQIEGDSASPLQFYLTDSTSNFLRGALYFNEIPNYDSLAPIINFVTIDVKKLIESTQWSSIKE